MSQRLPTSMDVLSHRDIQVNGVLNSKVANRRDFHPVGAAKEQMALQIAADDL